MDSAVLEDTVDLRLDNDFYARNLIGGRWQFPAAPYEFEIRSPDDSTIIAVVPLSSRLDVAAAFGAADSALRGTWAVPDARARLLHALLDLITASRTDLARLQCAETGLSPADSLHAIDVTLTVARAALADLSGRLSFPGRRGVRAHPVLGPAVHGDRDERASRPWPR